MSNITKLTKPWYESLKFNNVAINRLPIEPTNPQNPIYDSTISRQVTNAIFSHIKPSIKLKKPQLVAISTTALQLLHPNPTNFENLKNDTNFLNYFTAQKQIPGSTFYSHQYHGHQFGAFSGQLGDGTNCYFGQIDNENISNEIQLKGSGPTPYSRQSDGQKVLRSSIREFIASEYMHFLDIPTTRAGTIITDLDTKISRVDHTRPISAKNCQKDEYSNKSSCSIINYTDIVENEPVAVISRIAPSFLRFGSFEFIKSKSCPYSDRRGNGAGNLKMLHELLHYTIDEFYPECKDGGDYDYQMFFEKVVEKSAILVAKWQAVGFCHGVLNTDNMSILGLSIDYGPYAFLDYFDYDFTCNFSDHHGRYSFRNQPKIFEWNLEKFAEILNEDSTLKINFDKNEFKKFYNNQFQLEMNKKLGFYPSFDSLKFVEKLFNIMNETRSDFNLTFLLLEKFAQSGNVEEFGLKLAKICQSIEQVNDQLQVLLKNSQLLTILRLLQMGRPLNTLVHDYQIEYTNLQLGRLVKIGKLSNQTQDEKFANDKNVWIEFLMQLSSSK